MRPRQGWYHCTRSELATVESGQRHAQTRSKRRSGQQTHRSIDCGRGVRILLVGAQVLADWQVCRRRSHQLRTLHNIERLPTACRLHSAHTSCCSLDHDQLGEAGLQCRHGVAHAEWRVMHASRSMRGSTEHQSCHSVDRKVDQPALQGHVQPARQGVRSGVPAPHVPYATRALQSGPSHDKVGRQVAVQQPHPRVVLHSAGYQLNQGTLSMQVPHSSPSAEPQL